MSFSQLLRSSTSLALWLLIVFISYSHASSGSADDSPQALRGNWFYHWGDLPKDSASGQWQYQGSNWLKTDFPENMPNRDGHQIVWAKIDLPSGNWRDPYLFINAVDLSVEVFLNNEKLYTFGEIDQEGNTRFEGWPWHVFRLPTDYHQHTLYFRVASDYSSIGLSGEVVIGNQFQLLDRVYRSGITGMSFILIILLAGIISTVMGIIKKDRIVAFSTGLLSFNLAIMMFAENELSQIIFNEPLLWRYIAAFCYFLIPAFLAFIVMSWLKQKPPLIARIVFVVTMTFTLGVASLSMFTTFNFVNAYPYFDILFIILVLALFAGSIIQFYQTGITGSLMAFGIAALFIALLLDMLSAHGLITWLGHAGQWGLILFTLSSLMVYFVRDWQQQLALNTLTQELESQVNVRTKELEASQAKLEKMAREDYLTGLLNRRSFTESALGEVANAIRHQRPISLLLFDLDHFKNVNDLHGHSVGDTVLKAVADKSKEICRHGELVCRYGGEEFVILLHDTDAEFAQLFVSRLRDSLNEIEVKTNNQLIKVTASFGLITINCVEKCKEAPEQIVERLLAEADKMMYDVKISGRNGVKTLEIMLSQL